MGLSIILSALPKCIGVCIRRLRTSQCYDDELSRHSKTIGKKTTNQQQQKHFLYRRGREENMCAQHPHRFFAVVGVVVVVCMLSIHVAHAAHFLTSLSLPTVLPPPPSSSSSSSIVIISIIASSLNHHPSYLPKTEQNHSAPSETQHPFFGIFRSPHKNPTQIVASRWSPSSSHSVVVLQHEMNHWFRWPPVREPQHPDELHGSWLKPANL